MARSAVAFLVTVTMLFVGITVVKRSRLPSEASFAEANTSSERERVLRFWDRYRDATRYRTAGLIREAAVAYAEALAADDRHEDALYYSGNMLFELGDFSGAEDAWRRLIAVAPNSARAHSRLGDLHLCYDRPQSFDISVAESQYRRAAEINPEETGPLLRLGESALLRGDIAAAQSRFDQVLGTNPGSAEAHFLRGYIAWKAENTAEAATHTTRLVELMSGQEYGSTGLGEGDTESGTAMLSVPNVCRGVRDLTEALRSDAGRVKPEHIMALYRRADTLLTGARLMRR